MIGWGHWLSSLLGQGHRLCSTIGQDHSLGLDSVTEWYFSMGLKAAQYPCLDSLGLQGQKLHLTVGLGCGLDYLTKQG